MNKSVLTAIVLASLTTQAAAQSAQEPLDVFLEQRVAEELAADGTILSRLGVALDIEAVGDKLIVSLVDPATRRAVASTKVDSVPADREAAAAAVTQVAANLAAQLHGTPADGTAAVLEKALTDARLDRDAEYKFRQEAIYFGSELAVISDGESISTVRNVIAYQGDMRRRLGGRDFYEVVGRDDLAEAYDARRTRAYLLGIGGGVALLGGSYLFASNVMGDGGCDFFADNYDQCKADWSAQRRPYAIAGGVIAIGGIVGMGVGAYFYYHRHPISDSEIYNLGAAHNAKLRARYGLATAELRRPRTPRRSMMVAPYVVGDGGGLWVAGRF